MNYAYVDGPYSARRKYVPLVHDPLLWRALCWITMIGVILYGLDVNRPSAEKVTILSSVLLASVTLLQSVSWTCGGGLAVTGFGIALFLILGLAALVLLYELAKLVFWMIPMARS